MSRVTKHYVEYFEPGALMDETNSVQISVRSLSSISIPKRAYAFRFYDIVVDEPKKGPKLVGPRTNVSPMYYIKGTVYNLDQVRKGIPEDNGNILRNMEIHHYEKVIVTGPESAREFLEGDVLIS